MAKMINNDAFRKQAEKFAKDVKGDTLTFEVDKPYVVKYIGIETITFKKDKKSKSSDIVTVQDDKGNVLRYWSWGLLSYLINQKNPATGTRVLIKRLPKNKKGFWGCAFVTETEMNQNAKKARR